MNESPSSTLSSNALLSIAGVDAWIHSDIPLVYYDDPVYEEFLFPGDGSVVEEPAIDVEVSVSLMPVSEAPVVFECDVSWYMQPEPDGYRLSFRRNDGEHIHTVVCADRSTSHVRVFAAQDSRREPPFPRGVVSPVGYPLDQVMLVNHLASRGGVICHSAAAVVEGGALLFPGVSGAGKTTISRAFIDAGMGETLLSDDRVALRRTGTTTDAPEGIVAWGTPWPGDARIARNSCAPLAAVMFLVKADKDALVPVNPAEAMRRLMAKVSCPWYDPERLPLVLETCARVVESVPCYDLYFTLGGGVIPLVTGGSWR